MKVVHNFVEGGHVELIAEFGLGKTLEATVKELALAPTRRFQRGPSALSGDPIRSARSGKQSRNRM